MLSWLGAVPVALVGLAWLVVPGLLVTYGIGLRGIAAAAMAPLVSVGLIGLLAVLAGKLGLSWSVPLVLVVCLVVGVITAAIGFLLRHRAPARIADFRGVTVTALVSLIPALLLGAVIMVLGLQHPDELSQTYDAVFHYNALASIIDTHNASSLTIGSLATPGTPGVFYPAAWHDLTALVILSTGSSIPLAANMLSAAAALVVWPLSCVLLARQIFGPSRIALAATGLVSIGFSAFPWGLLGFGVLWPNLLAMSFAPAGMAVIISITGLSPTDPIGRGRAWLLSPVLLVAGGLAQPNVLFSLAALALFPIAVALGRRAVGLGKRGLLGRGIAECVLAAVVVLGLWYFVATTPALASVRTMYWRPIETPAQAFGEVVLNATDRGVALWVLSALVVIGIVLCRRQVALRWVVAGFAVTAFLFVVSAAINRPDTAEFTGYWYNDSYRLAAMLPITTVPLAVAAIVYLAGKLGQLMDRTGRVFPARGPVARSALAAAVVVVLVLVGTKGFYLRDHAAQLASTRAAAVTGSDPGGRLIDPVEQAFFAKIKNEIPAGVMVANNPWDGSALLWALAHRRVLFPHMSLPTSRAQDLIAQHLDDLATDPAVCTAARQLNVQYLLIGDSRFWTVGSQVDNRVKDYPGISDPGPNPGFQLVDSDGSDLELYRITGCTS